MPLISAFQGGRGRCSCEFKINSLSTELSFGTARTTQEKPLSHKKTNKGRKDGGKKEGKQEGGKLIQA